MPIPEKRELKRFCEIDGWEETQTKSPDHTRYRKKLPDGSILRTKVSHGRGPACDDPGLWTQIWRHQLALRSQAEFWETLDTGSPALRGTDPTPAARKPQMPAWLFEYLIHRIGLPEDEVCAMSEAEATEHYLRDIGMQSTT